MNNSIAIQYYKLVSISNKLANYIRIADLARVEVTSNIREILRDLTNKLPDIGQNIDIFA